MQPKRVHYCLGDQREHNCLTQWCASDPVNHFHFLPDRESAPGNGPEQAMYCWFGSYCAVSRNYHSKEHLLFSNTSGPLLAEIQAMAKLFEAIAGHRK